MFSTHFPTSSSESSDALHKEGRHGFHVAAQHLFSGDPISFPALQVAELLELLQGLGESLAIRTDDLRRTGHGWGTKWGPQTIAKLVNISPISLWFMVPITIVFMGFINHLISGGPHLVDSGRFTSCMWIEVMILNDTYDEYGVVINVYKCRTSRFHEQALLHPIDND